MSVTDSDLIPVVDYSRASADKRKDRHSVTNQQQINDETAARLGCRIVARFYDNDKSAAKDTVIREDFEAMLRVLRAGKLKDGTPVAGCIVVHDDRLIRRAGDYERFVDALTFQDGRVYADQRGFMDLYSENVENMGLMGAVSARIEVKKMRRRMRNHHRSKAREGALLPGHRPFGWNEDRTTLHPIESALMRQAVERFIAGGSINAICRDWQEKGVKTARGNQWTARTLTVALRNPRLCGWRKINDELIVDEDKSPVTGQWEPIVTPEQWLAVQEIFARRSGKQVSVTGQPIKDLPADFREHHYLLSGILRCGRILPDGSICNKRLRAGFHKERNRHRYLCGTKATGGCNGISRRGDLVDDFVSEAVLAKLEEREKKTNPNDATWSKQQELDDKVKQLRELRVRFAKRTITNNLFFEEVERLEPEIAKLQVEYQEYALAKAKADQNLTDIRRRWYSKTDEDRLDLSQKRAYIREALHAMIVHPAGKGPKTFDPDLLELVWREG